MCGAKGSDDCSSDVALAYTTATVSDKLAGANTRTFSWHTLILAAVTAAELVSPVVDVLLASLTVRTRSLRDDMRFAAKLEIDVVNRV